MRKVRCNMKPLGDIRVRQPKSPGQKQVFAYTVPPQCRADGGREPLLYNVPQQMEILKEYITVWANRTKAGLYRCCNCGRVDHEQA